MHYTEDIMQSIYLSYYKIISENPTYIQNDKNFIFKLAKNELSKYYISKQKISTISLNKSEDDNSYFEDIPSEVNIEIEIFNKFTIDEIWQEITKLDIITQKILMLYYSEDYKIKDIAHLLEMNESSVKTKLYRGINYVKQNLKEEE